jgi:hypothetical protein
MGSTAAGIVWQARRVDLVALLPVFASGTVLVGLPVRMAAQQR